MFILSSLIVKEWFKSLIGAVTVLFLLITTADLINGFLQGKDFADVLLEYALKMPDLMGKMFPICCLVASLFSFNKLKAHAELIAILSTGYSYLKIYLLVGACAISMVVVQFINLGFVEPMANKVKREEIEKSKKSEGKYLTRSLEGGNFWYKSKNYFATFSYFDRNNKSLHDFEIYFFSRDHKSENIIKAKSAKYVSDSNWQLSQTTQFSELSSINFPSIIHSENLTLALNEVPDDFTEFEADLTTLNFVKLLQFVNKLSKTDINISEYRIILWNKIFLSLICLVFSLLPLSSIFNPNRRSDSFGKNVVTTLLITVVFWVCYSSSVAFGNTGALPPIIATGLVPSMFFLYVLRVYIKNRKLV